MPDRLATTPCALGIDLGGTKVAAGLVRAEDGRILVRRQFPTASVLKAGIDPAEGGRALLEAVEDLARQIAAEAHPRHVRVSAIGVGICEIVDSTGTIRSSNAIPWEDLPVVDRLRRLAPVTLEADVRAAALAEARFGAGAGRDLFAYVTIGTGVSCCVVRGGKPQQGARGAAGTLASSPLPAESDPLRQESTPTLEQLGSGPGLVRRFREHGGTAERAEDVLIAASEGNLDAIPVVRTGACAIGAAIGWLVNVIDPELVILGGGLGMTEGLYRDALVAAVRRHIWWPGHRQLPIVSAATGRDAGIVGAALSALDAIQLR